MAEIVHYFVSRSIVYRHSVVKKLLRPSYCQSWLPLTATYRQMTSSPPSSPPSNPPGSVSAPAGSKPTPVTVERISDNLSFRPAVSKLLDSDHRPIVLIYAWLAAKSKHIHKFGDFYLDKGFDVLHIKVGAQQILWPPVAQSIVSDIVNFVTTPQRHKQPIFVHGFSVGGYLYGETLVRITSDPSLRESMTRRVRGHVFDSPVDFEGVPRGVGMAVSNMVAAQVAIKSTLEAYMSLFQRQVTQHYIRSSQAFHDNPLSTPSLVFYSKSDVIGTPGPIEGVIKGWKAKGIPVFTRCWENSPHVQHYLRDPVTYTLELNNFLHSIGLVASAEVPKVHIASPSKL